MFKISFGGTVPGAFESAYEMFQGISMVQGCCYKLSVLYVQLSAVASVQNISVQSVAVII